MNIFQEIRILAPRVVANAGKIVEGVSTNIKDKAGYTTDEESLVIKQRRAICDSCPFNSENAKKKDGEYEQLLKSIELAKGIDLSDIDMSYKSSRVDLHCTLCGCNIENKTACLTCDCGIAYFNTNYGTKMELKWSKIKN